MATFKTYNPLGTENSGNWKFNELYNKIIGSISTKFQLKNAKTTKNKATKRKNNK